MDFELVDTHCHIHEAEESFDGEGETSIRWKREGKLTPDAMLISAKAAGVTRILCVGTTVEDSELATKFVNSREGCWAAIGIHPHEAKKYITDKEALNLFSSLVAKPKVVAVGECGLDYYYEHSPKAEQQKMLR